MSMLLILIQTALPAGARRPDSAFRQGVQAADRSDWVLVEQQMRRAIQLDSEESSRKISIIGMRYEWYVPYYYLGLAHYQQGNLEAARRAWTSSRSQGVSTDWPGCDRFREQWAAVVHKIGPPPPSASSSPPPPPSPSPGVQLASAISSLELLIRKAGPPSTPLAEQLVEAAEALELGRRAKNVNRPASAALLVAARNIEAATEKLKSALARKPRTPQEVMDDVRALIDRLRQTPPSAAGLPATEDLEDQLVQAEIELSRNAPDLAALRRYEGMLLGIWYPALAAEK